VLIFSKDFHRISERSEIKKDILKPILGRDFEKDFKIYLRILAKNIGSIIRFIPDKSGEIW